MNNQILIGDFIKLTGSTLKTVLYYHKIGLLKEPKRSISGYRLYGAEDLEHMSMIKHLKHLGLDLKQIKEILGHTKNNRSLIEVLQSLQAELLIKKKNIDEQLSKIEILLSQEIEGFKETSFESKSFKMVTEILELEQVENYKEACPDLFNQQRNVFGVIDDFQWEKDYKENLKKSQNILNYIQNNIKYH